MNYGLNKAVIDKLQALFATYPQIERVLLFGSRAMGNFRTGSDIDLCIESQSLDLTQLLRIENEIDDLLLPWKFDLILKSKIDNPALLEHIRDKGIVFYTHTDD
ncbi:nucleotidyltransferase family protein [Legionella sp. CNM-4043-24]|uniref:nucleotidyltransferase family protein n=1 Tax=Legionella sp. CNM-4043-24 TaxID=3421646 RepID=UPI00403AF89D